MSYTFSLGTPAAHIHLVWKLTQCIYIQLETQAGHIHLMWELKLFIYIHFGNSKRPHTFSLRAAAGHIHKLNQVIYIQLEVQAVRIHLIWTLKQVIFIPFENSERSHTFSLGAPVGHIHLVWEPQQAPKLNRVGRRSQFAPAVAGHSIPTIPVATAFAHGSSRRFPVAHSAR
jgi:hypothetical protein